MNIPIDPVDKALYFFYRFYDNLSVVALGAFVFCGVSGAAIFMGVSAAGGISALEDRWDQVLLNTF